MILRHPSIYFFGSVLLGLVAGCSAPNQANIELRKQNQELKNQLEQLTRQRGADAETIRALEAKSPAVAMLPKDRLDHLYTAHGLTLGKLTGGWDEDPKKPGDEGIKVQATPIDEDNQPLKAAGSFVVELFDLSLKSEQRIGRWEFDIPKSRAAWLGTLLQYNYMLRCPWQTMPAHSDLTVKVTFRDELTGREFHAQQVIKVGLPPAAGTAAK